MVYVKFVVRIFSTHFMIVNLNHESILGLSKLKQNEREYHVSYDLRTFGKTHYEAVMNSENLIRLTNKNSQLIG